MSKCLGFYGTCSISGEEKTKDRSLGPFQPFWQRDHPRWDWAQVWQWQIPVCVQGVPDLLLSCVWEDVSGKVVPFFTHDIYNNKDVVWPTFLLMNVFIALKGSHFWFLFDFTAAGVVPCGGRKTSPRISTLVQVIFCFGPLRSAIIFWEIRNKWLV